MSVIQRATQIIAEAEASLRKMIGEAADAGDYTSVELLARWASSLGGLCQIEHQDEKVVARRGLQQPADSFEPREVGKSRTPKGPGKRRSYPFFARSGDTLIKVAWSKSSKSEYQHKSPRTVAVKLAEALSRQVMNGAIVAMEKVLPLKLDDGSQVPDYQVYVSLAWFRQIGAVKQKGRQGYIIKRPTELGKMIDAAWSELAEAKPF